VADEHLVGVRPVQGPGFPLEMRRFETLFARDDRGAMAQWRHGRQAGQQARVDQGCQRVKPDRLIGPFSSILQVSALEATFKAGRILTPPGYPTYKGSTRIVGGNTPSEPHVPERPARPALGC